jgi:hypothetical protein
MYGRFTDRARKVMQLAYQEAQRFNHEYIGTEHILLGLVKEGSGVAANVLKNLNIDLRKVRLEVEKIDRTVPVMVTVGKLPRTPRVWKVIEYALEEARSLNHYYVGTEHLLLGLLRDQEGVAGQVLMNLGLTPAHLRKGVLELLDRPPAPGVNMIERAGRWTGSLVRKLRSRKTVEAVKIVPRPPGEHGAIARLEQRTHALERQLSTVRFLLGTFLGAGAGIFLGDRVGAVVGLIAGGVIALLARLIPALLAGAIAGGLIAYGQFTDEFAAAAGAVVGALFAGCVLEIGRPLRRNPSEGSRDTTDPMAS